MSDDTIKIKSHSSLLALKIKKKLSEVPINDYLTSIALEQSTAGIQNGLLASRTHARAQQLTNIFLIVLGIDLFMLIIYYQLDFLGNSATSLWLVLSYLAHIVCSILLLSLYALEYDSLDANMKWNFNFIGAAIEFCLFLPIHPLPWINSLTLDIPYSNSDYDNLIVPIKVNYLILVATLLKGVCVFVSKSVINSQYMYPRANRIKKMYTVSAKQFIYAFRCIFRDHPIVLFLTYFMVGTALFAFCLKVIETAVPETANPFRYYQNCVWYMLITTTTVGYGEIRPFTHFGYCFIVLATIFGSLCISGTIFILLNALTLDPQEQAGLTAYRRVSCHLLYKENCRLYIRVTLWRLWTNYKNNRHVKESLDERKMRSKLREIRLEGKSFNSTGNITELCQREFDSAFVTTNVLCQNGVNLVNFINSHIFSENLFKERGIYTRSYISESYRDIQQQDDLDSEQDSYSRVRRKKVLRKSNFVEAKSESRKGIKIQLLKQPSAGDELVAENRIE